MMLSCILTVIKDEHLYLDEWIRYHLEAGVHHLFIFEDIGSLSHKEIADKYEDRVTLAPALSILDENELSLVLDKRARNISGGQKTYVKAGLRYIKDNYNYDWCFVIDIDEFITLGRGQDLDTILEGYKKYDAFVLSWKCYGANGLVMQPDYLCSGVVSAFTEVCKGRVPATAPEQNKKTCYNLHTYQDSFWSTIHVPSDCCDFCNAVFKRDNKSVCYEKIYLRHYITKSWEEYFWKKKVRGYFYGRIRTSNAFFAMNPDLITKKEILTNPKMLVVLPYRQTKAQGNEIRLSLAGWKKFCKFEYEFAVVGDYDESLVREFPWVRFIGVNRVANVEGQYMPHLDIQHKMEIAYDIYHSQYLGFIYMVDDNYAIKPFDLRDIMTIHYHQPSFIGVQSLPSSFWKHDKWKTRQLCDVNGFSHVNYTTHFPCYFNFERFKALWDKLNMRNESYVPEDVYFNSYRHPQPVLDDEIRLGIWNKRIFDEQFDDAVKNPNIKFVCNSPEGWSPELETALQRIIDEPAS